MRKWLCILLSLLFFTGCAQTQPDTAETAGEETVPTENIDTDALAEAMKTMAEAAAQSYTIKTALKAVVDDALHNADVNIPQVVFRDNAGLTTAVFEKITEPLLMEYAAYTDGAGIDFNWYTTDYRIYESEAYLAVTVLSYDAGTYVTCPRITGTVVDLETMTLLTMEEILQIQGQTAASAEEKIREMLVAVSDNAHPVWLKEITDAYMDENGDLIVVASTEVPRGDQPDNAALHYNLNRESVSVWATSQNLEDFTASFRAMPEDYVFDQTTYDAYYSEDHIPETMLVYHDDPMVEPVIVELPMVEPEQ